MSDSPTTPASEQQLETPTGQSAQGEAGEPRQRKPFWRSPWKIALILIGAFVLLVIVPNVRTANERGKMKRTMTDMRTIAVATEAYAGDNNAYPRVQNIDELAKLLVPVYMKDLPRKDGWNGTYLYEAADCESGRCQSYYVASGGRNSKMERLPPSAYGTTVEWTEGFDADLVYHMGEFIRAPDPHPGHDHE